MFNNIGWTTLRYMFLLLDLITIRLILAVAAQREWTVLDVKSAFLHGELKEEIFVQQPLGYEKIGEEDKVYKLKKALYSLK